MTDDKLSLILSQVKKYRLEFQLLKHACEEKSDDDIRYLVQVQYGDECIQFKNEFPHLFSFVCSSMTSEESVSKIEHAIYLKQQIVRGQISEEVGKKIFLESI
jgi:hypothetical protein